jgi:hypothetical protein
MIACLRAQTEYVLTRRNRLARGLFLYVGLKAAKNWLALPVYRLFTRSKRPAIDMCTINLLFHFESNGQKPFNDARIGARMLG